MAIQGAPIAKYASITNAKDVTAEDILAEANGIWKEANEIWRKKNIGIEDFRELDRIYEMFYEKHKELFSSYPTVLRHMLQEKRYHPDAFRRYLSKLKVKPWTNDEQRMDSYADYAVLLYKAIQDGQHGRRRWTQAEASWLWQDYRKRLQIEHDEFKKKYEKHRKDVEEDEKRFDKERREELLAIVRRLAQELNISTEGSHIERYTPDQLQKMMDILKSIKTEDPESNIAHTGENAATADLSP
jgi:protein-tyrosine-phosphatase